MTSTARCGWRKWARGWPPVKQSVALYPRDRGVGQPGDLASLVVHVDSNTSISEVKTDSRQPSWKQQEDQQDLMRINLRLAMHGSSPDPPARLLHPGGSWPETSYGYGQASPRCSADLGTIPCCFSRYSITSLKDSGS